MAGAPADCPQCHSVKGACLVVKIGTKVKHIRRMDGNHDMDCETEGFGAMKLKSEFVKKI